MRTLGFLFSDSRERVLSFLLLHSDKSYHVREIARVSRTSAGSLHRELAMLATAGLLIRESRGNQVTYQANIHFPIFKELVSILKKTAGISDVILNALQPLAKNIECAFIFGSFAKGTENQASDIDLLVIGDVKFVEIVSTLYETQSFLNREINPKVMTRSEWNKLIKSKTSFGDELLTQPKIFLLGNEDVIKESDRN